MTEKTYKVMGLAGGANIAIRNYFYCCWCDNRDHFACQRWKAAWCEKGTDILGRAL